MNKKYIGDSNKSAHIIRRYKNIPQQSMLRQPKKNKFDFISSISQAQDRDSIMKKRQNWYKQKRLRILQETFQQNCRLYISLTQQKSSYTCAKLLPNLKNTFKTINSNRKQKQNSKYNQFHKTNQVYSVILPSSNRYKPFPQVLKTTSNIQSLPNCPNTLKQLLQTNLIKSYKSK